MVSVIIPVFNESNTIESCLMSLVNQAFKSFEIILVNDGSTDKSVSIIKKQIQKINKAGIDAKLFEQNHRGPAEARNLGARKAKGEILIFGDADMTFDKNFIKMLIEPIKNNRCFGTFTKEEYVSNWNNVWARCWNYNQEIFSDHRIPVHYPDKSPVFRAIKKSEFEKVNGFDAIGFTDDWTLSRKLGYKAALAYGAVCYHRNPESLSEIYKQSIWIGKNEFISGSWIRKIYNLFRYNCIYQMMKGLAISFKTKETESILFQCVYSIGITRAILGSLLHEQKNK
jgi:glycosyltransferase involved in cell wall biosynthesis